LWFKATTVREALSRKTLHKSRTGEVAKGEGPEFKPQYHKTTTTTNQTDAFALIVEIIKL
jgi:hypothetical protein